MTSPLRSALPAAVTAAALVITTILPASAADDPHQNLNPAKGDVVSVETKELETVVEHPTLPSAPPRTGDKNPGATMGQKFKTMAETTRLSPASEKELEKVESAVLDGHPSPAPTKSVKAPDSPRTGTSTSTPASSGDEQGPGPAGSMSLVIRQDSWRPAGIAGMDVSGWQPAVNWSAEYAAGARFAYVKATEGTTYRSEAFNDQYTGSYAVGMSRGAYHFALPSVSSGAEQADFFVDSGGGWSADGRTLPGLLDVEYNPYPSLGNTCYNMSAAEMNAWIASFSNRYKQRTGRLPAIYTTTDWWRTCTGNTAQFNTHPLHIAAYGVASPGYMPNGWTTHDLWQFSDNGPFSGDSNVYGGSWSQFRALSASTSYRPLGGEAEGFPVIGGIKAIYNATGGAARWGAPITPERDAAYGGRYQVFSRDGVLSTAYWQSRTGAHIVRNTSGIGHKFIAAGRERGYGFPVTQERTIRGGAYQVFRTPAGKATKVMWTSRAGSHAIKEYGAIGKRWARMGMERGAGFPVTDEYRAGDEIRQRFSNGYTITYHTRTGQVRVLRG